MQLCDLLVRLLCTLRNKTGLQSLSCSSLRQPPTHNYLSVVFLGRDQRVFHHWEKPAFTQ